MINTILSVQSHVSMGHVGNSASTPVWQSLGDDVWAVPTVLYSSHPGYPDWQGHVVDTTHLAAILDGLAHRWHAQPAHAIVSGFFGCAEQVEIVAHFVKRIRHAHGPIPFVCDPVLGDHGKFYVDRQIQSAMETHLLPLASTLLPNQSELGWLVGQRIHTLEDAQHAAKTLAQSFQCAVVTTGIRDDDLLHILSMPAHGEPLSVTTPYHPFYFAGCGDVFGALYTHGMLQGWSEVERLEWSVSMLDDLLEHSIMAQRQSLALVSWLQGRQ